MGMGFELYKNNALAKKMFEQANEILGFEITETMFAGTPEDLRQTKVTQPAIFLHSVILAKTLGSSFAPNMVAGHSLGEFSALVAAGGLGFEAGLRLVAERAAAMQVACEQNPGTMAAVLGLEDAKVEEICKNISTEIVVAANYNCPGQLVISGTISGIDLACELLKAAGAKRALKLPVGGAFHSPLMLPAQERLQKAIENTVFDVPVCPIYQNIDAQPQQNPEQIKRNLMAQLTAPVLWTQTAQNMVGAGANHFIEVGPGNVLQGLVRKVSDAPTLESAG